MFYCIATKPLNDGTQGFRFNILGYKGLTRKRKLVSNGYKIERGKSMTKIHLGKRSLYLEHTTNKNKIRNFAG